LENGNTRFDGADEIVRGPPKLSDGEIQIAFVKTKTDVDFLGVAMQKREVTWSKGASTGVEKSEIGADKGQRGVCPNAGVSTIGDLSKQLAFAGLALAVLTQTRTSENPKPRPVENGRELV
jgi:hypothetical protein